MFQWIQTYAKTHLFYIILIVGGVVGFKAWQEQHDQVILAVQREKDNDKLVKDLRDGIASRDAQLAQKKVETVKIVREVKTPEQAVEAAPKLVPDLAPALQVKPAPDDKKAVEVQAMAFTDLLGQFKDTRDELQTCLVDLSDEKKIITVDEDTIKTLKKKPGFWKRVTSHGKWAIGGMVLLEAGKIYFTGHP
jgi:hypothetical protein